jgi:hypothetical protein
MGFVLNETEAIPVEYAGAFCGDRRNDSAEIDLNGGSQ